MGLFDIFKRSAESSRWQLSEALMFPKTAGKSAMRLSAVNAAVNIISDSIAVLPVGLADRKNKIGKDELAEMPVSFFFNGHHSRTAVSKYHLMKRLMVDMLIDGNGVAEIMRDKNDKFYALRYLKGCNVQYNQVTGNVSYECGGKNYAPENVVHLRRYTEDGVVGVGVMKHARQSIDLAVNTELSASKYFESGCNLQGVINANRKMSADQMSDFRASWEKAYGPNGSGIAIMDAGMEYKAIQQNASNSQLLESREYNVLDIARFFQLPPVLLGYSSGTFDIEQIQDMLVSMTLRPWIELIEEEFSNKLLTDKAERSLMVTLDENYLLRTNKTAQTAYYQMMLTNGVLSPNEVREKYGYAPVEGLDAHIVAYTDIDQNTINKKKEEEGE